MFAFHLAEQLGVPNVDRMLADMPGSMLVEWMAYFRIKTREAERARRKAGMMGRGGR